MNSIDIKNNFFINLLYPGSVESNIGGEINIKNRFLSKTLKLSSIVMMTVMGFFISLMVFGMLMIIGIIPEFPEAENKILRYSLTSVKVLPLPAEAL